LGAGLPDLFLGLRSGTAVELDAIGGRRLGAGGRSDETEEESE